MCVVCLLLPYFSSCQNSYVRLCVMINIGGDIAFNLLLFVCTQCYCCYLWIWNVRKYVNALSCTCCKAFLFFIAMWIHLCIITENYTDCYDDMFNMRTLYILILLMFCHLFLEDQLRMIYLHYMVSIYFRLCCVLKLCCIFQIAGLVQLLY